MWDDSRNWISARMVMAVNNISVALWCLNVVGGERIRNVFAYTTDSLIWRKEKKNILPSDPLTLISIIMCEAVW